MVSMKSVQNFKKNRHISNSGRVWEWDGYLSCFSVFLLKETEFRLWLYQSQS